jgi:hypothetical protein
MLPLQAVLSTFMVANLSSDNAALDYIECVRARDRRRKLPPPRPT